MKYQENKRIPKIIHQFWEPENGNPPSDILLQICETWKGKNPSWDYKLWNSKNSEHILFEDFPWFVERYHSFRYDVQRWDSLRYLILYKFGGVYADMDYECLEPLAWLKGVNKCCFGLDPPEHNLIFNKQYIISNAFIAVSPRHPFLSCVIKEIQNNNSKTDEKLIHVLETTGPYMLSKLYDSYKEKNQIWLIPSELISPICTYEVKMIMQGITTDEIANKIEKAYAVHYFFGSWY